MKKFLKWTGIVLLILIVLGALSDGNKTSPTTTQNTPTKQSQPTKAEVKKIPYEVFYKWSITNGGHGQLIVIDPKYFNKEDMPLLGETLKEAVKNEKNAVISVYTDRKAAQLRDKVLDDTTSKAEIDFYDKHYVGQYNKNGNSGLNQYVIYYDGVAGKDSQSIDY